VSDQASLIVVAHGNGRFSVVDAMHRRPAFAARSNAGTWVYFEGRVHVIRPASPAASEQRRRGHSATDDEAALSAPMPATVVSVNVADGQTVSRGDVLVTLEAMKMELVVRAPREGTVARVACRAGELVQPGRPLVELR
jgi:3-methylcrotonyl-CoA carboxylase alpha subunit